MRNPAGRACAHYYEDFARGAARRECRAPKKPGGLKWRAEDCAGCAVPGVLAANSNPDLDLRLIIRRGPLGLGRRVEVEAWCASHGPVIDDPHTGCPVCNAEADELLRNALE